MKQNSKTHLQSVLLLFLCPNINLNIKIMDTTIAPEKVQKKEDKNIIVFNPLIEIDNNPNLTILSIDFEDDYTRIDFLCRANPIYISGGWVQMDKDCFIRICGTESKLKLVKAVNVPIAPTKHFFKSTKDMLAYTLYFPATPKNTKKIDIIEREITGGTWFNFYGVSMSKVKQEVIIHKN